MSGPEPETRKLKPEFRNTKLNPKGNGRERYIYGYLEKRILPWQGVARHGRLGTNDDPPRRSSRFILQLQNLLMTMELR